MIKKPYALLQWEEWAKLGRPRCCHTCEHFNDVTGWCSNFEHRPPDEFIQLIDSCPCHKPGVPF